MDNKDFFEKSLNFGLGLAGYSKEKIEKLVDEMVQRGELKRQEAQEFTEELIKKGAVQQELAREWIKEEVAKVLKDFGYVPAEPEQTDLDQ